MTEAGRDSSQLGSGRDGGRLPGGFRERVSQAWATRPGRGTREAATGPELPPVPEPSLLPHEDIIETAKRRMTAIKDGEQATLKRMREEDDSAASIARQERGLKSTGRKIEANEETLGNWETFCTNARKKSALLILHDHVLGSKHDALNSRYNELDNLKRDKKTWWSLSRDHRNEYTAEMVLLDAQIKEYKLREEGLVSEYRAVPADDKDVTDKIDRVKDLRGAKAELKKAEDEFNATPQDTAKKQALEVARRAYKEKQKALNRPNGGVDLVRWEAEQELIDLYLDGGLYEGLDEEIAERREGLLRGIEPESNPSDVSADDELPDFLRREPPSVSPSGRRLLVPAAVPEARTGQPPRADRSPVTPTSRRSEQRGSAPVVPAVRPQERRAAPVAPARRVAPAAQEPTYDIPSFVPIDYEGIEQIAADKILALRASENTFSSLGSAKRVLARMSAGQFTDADLDSIRRNLVFQDPQYSGELRADLADAWDQGTQKYKRNRIMGAIGRIRLGLGRFMRVDYDMNEAEGFRLARLYKKIKRFIGPISANDYEYNNESKEDDEEEGTGEETEDQEEAGDEIEEAPVRSQRGGVARTAVTAANSRVNESAEMIIARETSQAMRIYENGGVLTPIQIELLRSNGVDVRPQRGAQRPTSRVGQQPVVPSRARTTEATPAISSAEATVTEAGIYRAADKKRRLSEPEFEYIQSHRELLDDPDVNRVYQSALQERKRRGV